jgi:dTDP-4-amino-4,6-dideoxygalactose transaminase
MVDLYGQYVTLKTEINHAISQVINTSDFINGTQVRDFAINLSQYLDVKHVIPCGNGTDALQIALMALNLPKGSEIIIPSFSFAAPAEVVALLGFTPVFADCDERTFNIDVSHVKKLITRKTSAIIPVHLFGQAAHLRPLLELAEEHSIPVIEDNAQSLGAKFSDGGFAGTVGQIGITSFFPSKNLGCMGDGGALFTNDDELASRISMISNHGQKIKYAHEIIGINSRLDTIQAAVLNVKLKYLNHYLHKRQKAAKFYDKVLANCDAIKVPHRCDYSSHVFNQYTLIVEDQRDALRNFLTLKGIPTMVYYPVPLHHQKAFQQYAPPVFLPVCQDLTDKVLSLPMHSELTEEQQTFICENVLVGLDMLNIGKPYSSHF